jgi:KRAB domain-containing zinc finger protein
VKTKAKSASSESGHTRKVRKYAFNKLHACTECGKMYKNLFGLKCHTLTHTGEISYLCAVCGRGFRHSCALKIHMQVHTGERPHVCDICGKFFGTRGNLKIHKLMA